MILDSLQIYYSVTLWYYDHTLLENIAFESGVEGKWHAWTG